MAEDPVVAVPLTAPPEPSPAVPGESPMAEPLTVSVPVVFAPSPR